MLHTILYLIRGSRIKRIKEAKSPFARYFMLPRRMINVVYQISFSKYLTAAYREAEAVWSDAEQAAFCELLEALETGDLDDRVKTKICDLMVDYVEVQRQLSATLQSTAVVWRPTEGRRADRV